MVILFQSQSFGKLGRNRISIVAATSMTFLFSGNSSFSQVIFDASGSKIGEIAYNGTVRNANGEKIGAIEYTGVVTDGSDMVIGEFENNGIVRNASGSRI